MRIIRWIALIALVALAPALAYSQSPRYKFATGQQTVASARVDTAPTLSGPIATDGIINQG